MFTRAMFVCAAVLACGASEFHALATQPVPPSALKTKLTGSLSGSAVSTDAAEATAASRRALLDKYCVTCHNARRRTGGVVLEGLDLEAVAPSAELWEKVIRKLRAGEMPPPGLPRPERSASDGLVSWLETTIDGAARVAPNPGRVAIHRLNRVEYTNAVRDVLALDVDGRALLPADDADQQGFDNNAGVLSVSPALLERYMTAARRISRLAVGDPAIVPVFDTYGTAKLLAQTDRMSEDLPFGSRGGMAVRHVFPVDGEYVLKVRLKRQLYDYIIGMGRPHQLDMRVDGHRVKLFAIGGEATGKPAPATFVGNIQGDPEWEKYMHEADERLEVRVPVKAGMRVVGVTFLDTLVEEEGNLQPDQTGFDRATNELYDGNPAVDSISIGGPFSVDGPGDSASRRRLFVCQPATVGDEEGCARKILSAVARRAYRRPVTNADVVTLLDFFAAGRADATFDAGIQLALERILAAPDFLFRIERDAENVAPGAAYRLSDIDLASRISFFLWSSVPDEELLSLAERGQLKQPAVLEQQVRRMLNDQRVRALVTNFAGQWLEVRKVQGLAPDPDLYPDFDDNLREAFAQETLLFFENELREDRPVPDLLSANYTYLNERLARHYGIANVYGSRFRRVTLAGEQRRGLLGHGSILAVSSYPNRTSPVLRGKWVLDNILGTPPPPPPPDVPGLKESGENGTPLTVRAMMEQHRKNPACASCHVRMDPLGFALENFDATGRWRSTSNNLSIDASGTLPDGTTFQGVTGLREILVSHNAEFVGTVTQKLLTYGLGRVVEFSDQPAIRSITRNARSGGYRWSALILGIVKSEPFQMRRSES